MDDTNAIGRRNSACTRCCVAAYSDSRPGKNTSRMGKFFCAALFISLSWNAFAATGQLLPEAQVQLDEIDTPASFEAPVGELIAGHAENSDSGVVSESVITVSEKVQSEFVDQELASLDVVDTGVLRQIQNPQPSSILPREATSLDVIDTGTSKQVQNPQSAATVLPNTEESSAVIESENVSTKVETEELGTGVASMDDHQARNYKVMLPVTDLANKNEVTSTVSEIVKNNGRSEVASGGVASEEAVGLPYAVLLAILALMSMIPVARRKG